MTLINDLPAARTLVRLHHQSEIVDMDERRAMLQLAAGGVSQREIAALLGVTQPTVNGILKRAANLPQPAEGFSSATPMEACKRYAAGLLARDQLVDELVRFPYAAVERDPFDDFSADPPGAWSEVEDAEGLGLIEEDVYEEIFNRRHPAPEGQ
ncbi:MULTISPECIES: helix-turn-helix domain-containing protein [Actinomycetes]|nr:MULTISPECIES: helix-turn-helix domain-containing protein [Actinomycetes]